MTKNPLCIQLDPARMVHTLQHEAVEMLGHAGGELILDFSAVRKIDAAAAKAMEDLADLADKAFVRIELRAVDIGIYRALKLLKLGPRFTLLP